MALPASPVVAVHSCPPRHTRREPHKKRGTFCRRAKGCRFTSRKIADRDIRLDRFVVQRVELAYHEGHADFPAQAMQPYFMFWNDAGQVLAIPAVADSHVEW